MVKLIVVTGGPCSGKDTGIPLIKEALEKLGHTVLVAPEAATHLMGMGIPFDWADPEQSLLMQLLIFEHQVLTENSLVSFAVNRSSDTIILCNRGLLDGKAYIEEESFSKLLEAQKCTEEDILSRYSAVIHLTTTAYGAEAYYSLNNPHRREKTLEDARAADNRTASAWLAHPNHFTVDNGPEGFEGKIAGAVERIRSIL